MLWIMECVCYFVNKGVWVYHMCKIGSASIFLIFTVFQRACNSKGSLLAPTWTHPMHNSGQNQTVFHIFFLGWISCIAATVPVQVAETNIIYGMPANTAQLNQYHMITHIHTRTAHSTTPRHHCYHVYIYLDLKSFQNKGILQKNIFHKTNVFHLLS